MTPKELADLATELNTRRYSRKGETEMICSKAAEAIRTILANGYAPEGMAIVPLQVLNDCTALILAAHKEQKP
jgi:hypothetical protein